jgi:hypothetical protein
MRPMNRVLRAWTAFLHAHLEHRAAQLCTAAPPSRSGRRSPEMIGPATIESCLATMTFSEPMSTGRGAAGCFLAFADWQAAAPEQCCEHECRTERRAT